MSMAIERLKRAPLTLLGGDEIPTCILCSVQNFVGIPSSIDVYELTHPFYIEVKTHPGVVFGESIWHHNYRPQ